MKNDNRVKSEPDYWRWHDAVGLPRPGRAPKPSSPIFCPEAPAPTIQRALPNITTAAAYANALQNYERQLVLVEEQLDREWLAFISGQSDLRYRHKTKVRLQYLEGMIARIKYVHLPALSENESSGV